MRTRITLPSGTEAALVRPGTDTARGLVIAPDILGLRPLFEEMAERLAAEQQVVVCVPEPFPGQDLPDVDARFAAVARHDDDRVLGDLAAAADATGCPSVGLIGFCMGGMYALKAAGLRRFDRVVSFYGMIRVPPAWKGPGHREPLDAVQVPGASPTLAIVGERDPYTPPEDIAALDAAGVQVVRYPEAEHGFVHDPSRPAHRPDDAQDAWGRAFAFLAGTAAGHATAGP